MNSLEAPPELVSCLTTIYLIPSLQLYISESPRNEKYSVMEPIMGGHKKTVNNK